MTNKTTVPVLETERLILRPLALSDLEAVFRWAGDERVNRFMIYPLYKSADDIKAGADLASINDMLTLLAMSPDYVENGIALDKKIYKEYPEIQSLCDAADAMSSAFGVNANNCGADKTLQQKVIDDLTTDYFGILASVLFKHNVISSLKDFIRAVD